MASFGVRLATSVVPSIPMSFNAEGIGAETRGIDDAGVVVVFVDATGVGRACVGTVDGETAASGIEPTVDPGCRREVDCVAGAIGGVGGVTTTVVESAAGRMAALPLCNAGGTVVGRESGGGTVGTFVAAEAAVGVDVFAGI